jgi:EmrB/QacA subfamily drug resistance transporter
MTVLIVAQFMDLVDSTITNVTLVPIQRSLHATPAQLEWVMAAYMISFATLLITGGRLGDIVGRQRVFLVGVVGFGLASLAAAMAQNGDVLIGARAAQGAFAGIMVPQVLSSAQVLFKPDERAKIYGLMGALGALGSVVGLVLGGWMVTADLFGLGWRSIFLVNVPVCVLLVIATLAFVPNSTAEQPVKLDILGVVLSAAVVFLVVFPLIDGHHAKWAPWIWGMLAAAPVVGIAFVLQQRHRLRRDGSPMLPMQLFRNRGFASGLAVQTLFWMANGSYMLIIGYYLQQGLNFTSFRAGLALFAMTVGAFIGTPAAEPLSKKFGKQIIFLGGIIQAAAFAWLLLVIHSHDAKLSIWALVPPLAVAGIGLVFLVVPLLDAALATVPEADAGAASGTFNTFQQVGFALGVAVAGVIFFRQTDNTPTFEALKSGVVGGMVVTVAAFALAGITSLLLPKRRTPQTQAGGTIQEPESARRVHGML